MKQKTFDTKRIIDRFQHIEYRLRELNKLRKIPEEKFIVDNNSATIAERHLQVAIQACIDIANHLVSVLGLKVPDERKDIFRILAAAEIISKDLADNLVEMAQQRNILVHEYLEVERSKIHKSIRHHLKDVTYFVS